MVSKLKITLNHEMLHFSRKSALEKVHYLRVVYIRHVQTGLSTFRGDVRPFKRALEKVNEALESHPKAA